MSARLSQLYRLHDEINYDFFNGILLPIRMRLEKRNTTKWAWYQYSLTKARVPRNIERSTIHIHVECFADPDLLLGTMVHEMVHQWQAEIVGMECDHGELFMGVCASAEEFYGVDVEEIDVS